MRFDAVKLAIAATVTVFVCYGLCTLAMFMYPEYTLKMTGSLLFIPKIEELISHWDITWFNVMSGSIQMIVWTFLFTFVFAWMYNWMLGTEKGKK